MKLIERDSSHSGFSSYCFKVNAGEADTLIDWFCGWFESCVDDNTIISHGQELQLGWALLSAQLDETKLTFLAPDFKSFPLQWSENLSNALQLLAHHKFIPESYDLQADIPSLKDIALVGERFERLPMFMTRSDKDTNAAHSGWFIASSSQDADNADPAKLKMMSLYEVFIKAPHVLEYLSMPVGTQVVFESKKPIVLSRNKELKPTSGSFVAENMDSNQ